jgi:hypothetical protein
MAIEPNQFVTELAKKLSDQRAAQIPPADLANALARQAGLPELVTFAGYLGGTVQDGSQTEWRVLYLDTHLQRWLLVRDTDVLYNVSVDDETSPSSKRDVIWVRADASVGGGSGSQPVEARFLTGAFTRAADYEAPPSGGTTADATGVDAVLLLLQEIAVLRRVTRRRPGTALAPPR